MGDSVIQLSLNVGSICIQGRFICSIHCQFRLQTAFFATVIAPIDHADDAENSAFGISTSQKAKMIIMEVSNLRVVLVRVSVSISLKTYDRIIV